MEDSAISVTIFIIGIILYLFFLGYTIYHAAVKNKSKNSNLWVTLIILLPLLGMVFYWVKDGKTNFLIVYLLFHLILLVGTIYLNVKSESPFELIEHLPKIAALPWFAVAGIILFFINVIIIAASDRYHSKKEEGLRQEINSLKAKLYDLEDTKSSVTPVPPTSPVKPEEKDSSPSDDKTIK